MSEKGSWKWVKKPKNRLLPYLALTLGFVFGIVVGTQSNKGPYKQAIESEQAWAEEAVEAWTVIQLFPNALRDRRAMCNGIREIEVCSYLMLQLESNIRRLIFKRMPEELRLENEPMSELRRHSTVDRRARV
ncbi:hypothetical protein LCGC14_0941880 [marine sediment metagenome]|uniref:Uncharacterized protein n=1 Tax=marine sediment metagenome TaxID=412755 RepID=A0A0F9NPG4_9ZZZZ